MVRDYAKWVGLLIVLIGVVGLVAGEEQLLGLLNIDIVEDIVHLVTGGLMAYVGFRGTTEMARTVVGVLGVVYLLVGILGFVLPDLGGLLPHGYGIADNLIHLVLGIVQIALAWFIGRDRTATTTA